MIASADSTAAEQKVSDGTDHDEQPGQMGEGLVVELGPNRTQMVDDKAQIPEGARGGGRPDTR